MYYKDLQRDCNSKFSDIVKNMLNIWVLGVLSVEINYRSATINQLCHVKKILGPATHNAGLDRCKNIYFGCCCSVQLKQNWDPWYQVSFIFR